MSNKFKYEIIEKIAILSNNGKGITKEINWISFNGNEAVLDIRKWNRNNDTMIKGNGISLNLEEAIKLIEATDIIRP